MPTEMVAAGVAAAAITFILPVPVDGPFMPRQVPFSKETERTIVTLKFLSLFRGI